MPILIIIFCFLLIDKTVDVISTLINYNFQLFQGPFLIRLIVITYAKFIIIWGVIFYIAKFLRSKKGRSLNSLFGLICFIYVAIAVLVNLGDWFGFAQFKIILSFSEKLNFFNNKWIIILTRYGLLLLFAPLIYFIGRELKIKNPKKITAILYIGFIMIPLVIFPEFPKYSEIFSTVIFYLFR